MLIAVDATPIRDKPSGIGFYTLNLINSLAALQDKENFDLTITYQPGVKQWLRGNFKPYKNLNHNLTVKSLPLPVTVSHLLAKFPNPILPFCEGFLGKPDILHGCDHYVYPAVKSLNIMTIHDLTFIKYPEYTNVLVKQYEERVKFCLKWTKAIITFSLNTKQEIIEYLKVPEDKIFITPQASRYGEICLSKNLSQTINFPWNIPYILFVSTLEPRKNIINLIKAFNRFKTTEKTNHNLVLIGQLGWNYQAILTEIANSPWRANILHLGYLSDELVGLFYQQAEVFVYPSFYEGFGLPVLEAMTLGVPVITSNTSSLPEVAGNAAILINPDDDVEIAQEITRVVGDRSLKEQLREKGKQRAKMFSWEKTALNTLAVYNHVSD